MDGLTQPETADFSQAGDADLQRRIIGFLLQRGLPNLQYLKVEVCAGVATLRGQVRTFYEKQLATNCCQRVAGVLRIVNDIQVMERHSQPPVSETQISYERHSERKH